MSAPLVAKDPIAFGVSSDIKCLRKVIVHRPDPGIEWVTPANAESLLYDDIVFLPQMMKQHQVFVSIMQALLGDDTVIEFQSLLATIVQDMEVRHLLLEAVCDFEQVGAEDRSFLQSLPAVSLAATLISGVIPGLSRTILPPLPNHIFTRDIGVVINHGFLTCMASKEPRMRESILTWFVSHYHPLFKPETNQFIDLCDNPQELLEVLRDPQIAIEGGDVMVIDEDHVFIGCSERTNEHTIKKVAQLIFDLGVASNVTLIDIPKLPTCIHLDTLFTQISSTDFVYYRPFLGEESSMRIEQYQGSLENRRDYGSLRELLMDLVPDVQLIPCGNGRYPYQEREQYASGCNFVSLKDGVAISYARNIKTLDALKEYGYQVVEARSLLEQIANNSIQPEAVKQTVITIPSSELSRAGGGPHCLTLPVIRE